MSMPREMLARVTQGSFLLPPFNSMYIHNSSQRAGVYLAHFADDRKMFSESCSAVSIQLRPGESDGT
jgi:hypothetical protein